MIKNLFLIYCILSGVSIQTSFAQRNLKNEIRDIINTVAADVGVAIKHLEKGDTLSLHGSDHFPTQSIYKFHLALAVMSHVDEGKLTLDQKIFLPKEQIRRNTVSPIAKMYPDGNVSLSVRELLKHTVCQSDNNGCDFLFRLLGGPACHQSIHPSIHLPSQAPLPHCPLHCCNMLYNML